LASCWRAYCLYGEFSRSALLEVLVHLELGDLEHLPDSYQLLRIDVPDSIAICKIDESSLDPGWRKLPEISQGDRG
jgi:hypothetical protein